ncbi:MAG TPA: hypothetical protein VLT32_16680 [Candidatus Sulfomarinibacteraceae bacterium]|nr:hypothetical protein [Candidatus Sulfomarinibacteraceae bacterium]
MKTWLIVVIVVSILVAALVVVCFVTGPCGGGKPDPTTPPRKVAVLVSTDFAYFDIQGNGGYWNDVVLTYCMLRRNGFADDDIYVVYGDGRDGFYVWEPDGGDEVEAPLPQLVQKSGATGILNVELQQVAGELLTGRYYEPPYCVEKLAATNTAQSAQESRSLIQITDFPFVFGPDLALENSTSRPEQVLDCLAKGCTDPKTALGLDEYRGGAIERLDANDFLFFWWRGHGSAYNENRKQKLELSLLGGLQLLPAATIVEAISKINAGRRLIVFETCDSGCACNEIDTAKPPTIVFTSSSCEEPSNGVFTPAGGVPHALWTYWIDGTLMGGVPIGGFPRALETSTVGVTTKIEVGNSLDVSYRQATSAVQYSQADPQTPRRLDEGQLSSSTRLDVDDPTNGIEGGSSPTPGS